MRSPASRTFRRDLQGKTPRSKVFGSKSNPRFKCRQPGRNPILAALAQWDLSTLILCYAQSQTDFGRGASDNVVNGDAVKIFCRRRRGGRWRKDQVPTLKMGENLNKLMTSTGYRSRFASEAPFA